MTKSDLHRLLTGRGSGGPLFLAWCLGVVATYFIIMLFRNTRLEVIALATWLVLLSCWQAILLLPSWWRRGVWLLCHLVFVTGSEPFESFNSVIWTAICWATIVQSLLFLGVRTRLLLWGLVAVTSHPAINPIIDYVYIYFRKVFVYYYIHGVPVDVLPEFPPAYYLMATIVFGLVAAYFMPPVYRTAEPPLSTP
jgi:hypothetical protein